MYSPMMHLSSGSLTKIYERINLAGVGAILLLTEKF
jgi:hypothetical protein